MDITRTTMTTLKVHEITIISKAVNRVRDSELVVLNYNINLFVLEEEPIGLHLNKQFPFTSHENLTAVEQHQFGEI